MAFPVETKVKAGAAGSATVGLVTYLLVLAVPAFHNGVPAAVTAVIPFVVSFISGTVAAYLAPHTNRPLPPPAPPKQPQA